MRRSIVAGVMAGLVAGLIGVLFASAVIFWQAPSGLYLSGWNRAARGSVFFLAALWSAEECDEAQQEPDPRLRAIKKCEPVTRGDVVLAEWKMALCKLWWITSYCK